MLETMMKWSILVRHDNPAVSLISHSLKTEAEPERPPSWMYLPHPFRDGVALACCRRVSYAPCVTIFPFAFSTSFAKSVGSSLEVRSPCSQGLGCRV